MIGNMDKMIRMNTSADVLEFGSSSSHAKGTVFFTFQYRPWTGLIKQILHNFQFCRFLLLFSSSFFTSYFSIIVILKCYYYDERYANIIIMSICNPAIICSASCLVSLFHDVLSNNANIKEHLKNQKLLTNTHFIFTITLVPL
jgi:hypothetical protein